MSEVRLNIAYACRDIQHALNVGLNAFGAILLVESFGDDPQKFPLGGVMLVAETHSRVPVYVTVSLEPPQIVDPEAFAAEQKFFAAQKASAAKLEGEEKNMSQRMRLKMLDAALRVLEDQTALLVQWTALELKTPGSPAEEAAQIKELDDLDADDLLDGMDEALQVFVEARNKYYAEARGMTVYEASLRFTNAALEDRAEMDKER